MKMNLNKVFKVIFILVIFFSFSIIPNNFSLVSAQNEAVNINQGNIETLKFKDANIKTVIRSIATKAYRDGRNVNIVTSPNVTGMVTVDLSNVNWREALQVVLKSQGYGYEWVGNHMIWISTLEEIAKRRDQEKTLGAISELRTEVFILNFTNAVKIEPTIKKMLTEERGQISIDSRTNAVIVTDTQTNIDKIQKTIKSLDKITKQVLIEAKIIETSLNNTEKLGIKWDLRIAASGSKRPTTFPWTSEIKGTGTKMFPKVKVPDELKTVTETDTVDGIVVSSSDKQEMWNKLAHGFPPVGTGQFLFGTIDFSQARVLLEALSQESDTNIVSNPKILTLDSQPADIKVSTQWPIPKYDYNDETGSWEINDFEFKDIGVLFHVLPQINDRGYITMEIKPEVSSIVGETSFVGTTSLPIISTQTTNTNVMVKDGDTLVIGGLIKTDKTNNMQKVPILGDIPFLGKLFTHKGKGVERKDLLIFITPRIISSEEELEKEKLNLPTNTEENE